MAKQLKSKNVKSLKKALLQQVEESLSASLMDFPKKKNKKKYQKVIHKAGKMITRSLVISPVKKTVVKEGKKNRKKNSNDKLISTAAN